MRLETQHWESVLHFSSTETMVPEWQDGRLACIHILEMFTFAYALIIDMTMKFKCIVLSEIQNDLCDCDHASSQTSHHIQDRQNVREDVNKHRSKQIRQHFNIKVVKSPKLFYSHVAVRNFLRLWKPSYQLPTNQDNVDIQDTVCANQSEERWHNLLTLVALQSLLFGAVIVLLNKMASCGLFLPLWDSGFIGLVLVTSKGWVLMADCDQYSVDHRIKTWDDGFFFFMRQ